MLLVHAERIVADAERRASAGARVIDLGGATLLPGPIDTHMPLCAATKSPAERLGRTAEIGTLGEGKRGDLVALEGDPLTDVMVLWKVKHFVLRGRQVDLADAARRAVA